MRVNSNGLLHLEQGGRSFSTNLKFGGWAIGFVIQRLCWLHSESFPQRELR
jgi:hypothetical protein